MKERIDINLRESGKLFRNFIRNLREKAAGEAAESETMKNEMMTKSDQKKIK